MSRAPFGLARRAVVLAAGVALTATMVSAPTTGQASELRKSARAATEVVPVVADLQITRTTVDTAGERQIEREIHHFYRDSMARTRVESGTSVTITSPRASDRRVARGPDVLPESVCSSTAFPSALTGTAISAAAAGDRMVTLDPVSTRKRP